MGGGVLNSQGEKPPKIRKKSSQEQSSWELFGPPPTEKTEKIGKIKGTLVRKVPGNLRSQEFVFFSWAVFLPPINCGVQCSATVPSAAREWREGTGPLSCTPPREGRMPSQKGRLPSRSPLGWLKGAFARGCFF